ncbi:resuscitation-promoting factor [Nocardioides daejeonensis]|uniref:resuscitation-promoting factor n=1 Tax=Nocardioides daejeonensis TaxID=1046556 RepID=UPI000D747965|nr:resuscitation-promoting factor [Nocardioides daejeonensis]
MRAQLARLTKSKPLLFTLVAAVLLAVVGTTAGYASLNKEVNLSVDGESRTVSTMGSTVGDVLESEGIDVTERDIVLPGLDEKISDGTRIAVKFARPLELTVDGKQATYWVTSTDVNSALAEVGRRYAGADLSTSRSTSIGRDGLALEVATPKKLTIKFGARDKVVKEVAGLTVADVLEKLELEVDKDDIVKPRLGATLEEGDSITVTKVRIVKRDVAGEQVPFQTVERKDASMYTDESTTLTEGRTGLRDVTYRLVFHNGELQVRKVVDQTVRRKSVDKVVKVGTKERPATTNYAPGNTVWDRLAQCESGGNWAANTGNGYYGGLQFSASTWRAVGGSGLPHQASRAEQIKRGSILQQRSGWGQWPACSAALGLR